MVTGSIIARYNASYSLDVALSNPDEIISALNDSLAEMKTMVINGTQVDSNYVDTTTTTEINGGKSIKMYFCFTKCDNEKPLKPDIIVIFWSVKVLNIEITTHYSFQM